MGTGIGIECKRCGDQLDLATAPDTERELCGDCVVELRKKEYDETINQEEEPSL